MKLIGIGKGMILAFLAASVSACGGTASSMADDSAGGSDAGVDAEEDVYHHKKDGGKDAALDTSSPDGAPPKDAFADYYDEGCPPVEPVIVEECDPWIINECGPGYGCYPFVYPPEEVCGPETYGTVCYPVGTAGQDDPCGGLTDCAAGFVCVITGAGTQCVRLCDPNVPGGCDDGRICETIDVPGFGGCL